MSWYFVFQNFTTVFLLYKTTIIFSDCTKPNNSPLNTWKNCKTTRINWIIFFNGCRWCYKVLKLYNSFLLSKTIQRQVWHTKLPNTKNQFTKTCTKAFLKMQWLDRFFLETIQQQESDKFLEPYKFILKLSHITVFKK